MNCALSVGSHIEGVVPAKVMKISEKRFPGRIFIVVDLKVTHRSVSDYGGDAG